MEDRLKKNGAVVAHRAAFRSTGFPDDQADLAMISSAMFRGTGS